jgi:uncharacterized protein YbjT (DUF2867 family)
MNILVAGASGLVGSEVVALLRAAGHTVRTLSRSAANAERLRGLVDDVRLADATDPASLAGVCDGIEVVFSSIGAAVAMQHPDRRGYRELDFAANVNLLAEAQRAGVRRFVYVAAHVEPAYRETAYIAAHEAVVEAMRQSGLAWAVVRPTGIFGALDDFVTMAARGRVPLIGSGAARTNPVHQRDVAEACVRAIESEDPALDVAVGGPDVVSRREIALLAFDAVGRRPRLLRAPALLMRLAAWLIGLIDRRRGELFAFVTAISITDCVAPAVGTRRLADYFRERAVRAGRAGPRPLGRKGELVVG